MTDTTCPACGRSFRSLKGRSGHLATFNDGTHASYRQAHGMRVPLGPDHKPTKAGARVRGKAARPAGSTAAPAAGQAGRGGSAASDFRQVLQELTEKSLEANRVRREHGAAEHVQAASLIPVAPPAAPAPLRSAPTAASPSPAPPPAEIEPDQPAAAPSKAPGEKWLLVGGATAAGLGLAALVGNLKGANAPKPEEFPKAPAGRPPMSLPDGIWAKPEAKPETTGNPWLDQQLGYSGGIKHRRHTL